MIDLGDVYPLTFNVTDADGNPANATAVTLTITLPDQTTTSPAVTNPPATVGIYACGYPTTQAGRHTVRWVATGTAAGSYTDVFDIADLSVGPLVSLAVAKQWLRKDPAVTTDDEELRDLIDATTPVVEDVVGPVVVRQFAEDFELGGPRRWGSLDSCSHGYHRPWYGHRAELALGQKNTIALVSVTPILTGGLSYDVNALDLSPAGIVRQLSGAPFHGPLRVTYTAGMRIIPGNVLHGAKEIIRHAWDTQRGHAAARPGLGDDDLIPTPSGFLIPRRAMEWLQPHDRGPVLA